MLERNLALGQILRDLRSEVGTTLREGLGKLALVTLTSHLPSMRPPDEVNTGVTGISGVAAFIELLPREPLAQLPDPLSEEVGKLLG